MAPDDNAETRYQDVISVSVTLIRTLYTNVPRVRLEFSFARVKVQ